MTSPPIDPLRRRAIARLKVTHYLLDPEHPKGGSKERFFAAFGFKRSAPDVLAYALLDHAATGRVSGVTDDQRGWIYEVTGPLTTPDGRDPEVVSVWIVRHFGAAEFVTAYRA